MFWTNLLLFVDCLLFAAALSLLVTDLGERRRRSYYIPPGNCSFNLQRYCMMQERLRQLEVQGYGQGDFARWMRKELPRIWQLLDTRQRDYVRQHAPRKPRKKDWRKLIKTRLARTWRWLLANL